MAKKRHYTQLPYMLKSYAKSHNLDFQQYSTYHMRLMDGGFCVLDIWTTGRYFALTTDYQAMESNVMIRERGGEKGFLPMPRVNTVDPMPLYDWLDKFFFAPYMDKS